MPTPTATWRTWFPFNVNIPGRPPLFKARVYATDAGLIVYTQDALPDPVYQSRILLDKTPQPHHGYAHERRGLIIETEDGKVVLTRASCACGANAIKTFVPGVWAAIEKPWGEA